MKQSAAPTSVLAGKVGGMVGKRHTEGGAGGRESKQEGTNWVSVCSSEEASHRILFSTLVGYGERKAVKERLAKSVAKRVAVK